MSCLVLSCLTIQDDSVDEVEELQVTDSVDFVTEPVTELTDSSDVVLRHEDVVVQVPAADETCDSSPVSVDTSSGSSENSTLEGSQLESPEAPEELTFSFNHFDDEDAPPLNDSALSNTIPYCGSSVAGSPVGSPATSSFLGTPPRRSGRLRFQREITTYDRMGVPSTSTANGGNKSKTKKKERII